MSNEPSVEFETLHEIVQRAKLNLSRHLWDYLVGGTETETTLRRNRHALDAWGLRPRVLNECLAGRLLGRILGPKAPFADHFGADRLARDPSIRAVA